MDYAKQCRLISNSFYNIGLEKANIRDLSGAADCLKKSIHFNKYHIEARNLLGLVYYEIGETAEALVQWVISSNLQPEKNRAVHYLHEIQGRPGRLEAEGINIKKYNQALAYAQSGSDDLAILQLSRVVEHNPHFVKAHMVLALLYMNRSDYTKAGKSLYKVLQIDKNNPKALWYMSIVKANTGRAEVEHRKFTKAFSHRQMQDDDVIMPPTYKENTGWQTIINIIVGLIMGAVAVFFLVMPTMQQSLNQAHNQEMTAVLEQVNQKNQEADGLRAQIEQLQAENGEAQAQLQTIDGANQGVLSQYQGLVRILEAYRTDNFTEAVRLYAGLDSGVIEDAGMQEIIGRIRQDMEANGYQVLAELGNQARDAGNAAEALDYYQKSLNLHGDNPQVMYDMAAVYQSAGDEEHARELWGQVIMNYPNTDLAAQAKTARGY